MFASEFLRDLQKLSKSELLGIKGMGEVLSQNIEDFTHSERFTHLLNRFEDLEKNNKGIQVDLESLQSNQEVSGPLIGQTICITGSFEIPRVEIKMKLEELGAKVVDTVSSHTTILLAGEKSGSKLAKAEKLGVKIVSELQEIMS